MHKSFKVLKCKTGNFLEMFMDYTYYSKNFARYFKFMIILHNRLDEFNFSQSVKNDMIFLVKCGFSVYLFGVYEFLKFKNCIYI